MCVDGKGECVCYFEIELINVMISSVVFFIELGEILNEVVGLKYFIVKWKYIQQKKDGGIVGNILGGWDLLINKVI